MPICALCSLHGDAAPTVGNPIGLLTSREEIIAAASRRFDDIEGEAHVLVAVCPEHVVDIYRGRLPRVRMAWRIGSTVGQLTGDREGLAAGSSSRA